MTAATLNDSPKREILVFYYKYRLRLFVAFLLPFLLAVLVSFMPVPRYQAESTLVVRLGSEYVYQPEGGASTNGPASPIPFDRDQIYKAEVAILGSYDLHEQVVRSIGLDRIYPVSPTAGRQGPLGRALAPVRALTLSGLSALETVLPPGTGGPIDEMNAAIRNALSPEKDLAGLSDADRAQRRLQMAVQTFDKHLDIVLGKDSSVITVTFQHRDRAIAIQSLDTLLRLYLAKRKQLYTDNRGTIATREADITRHRATSAQAAVEAFKRDHKIYSLPDQRAQLLAQREEVHKRMQTIADPSLEARLADITRQLDELDAQDRQYNALQHDLQMANDEDALYAHKLDEAQAYDNLEKARVGSVRVVQPPAAPPEPKRLQGLILLAGFFIALVFTVFIAALTEFSRSGFLTPERLERSTGLPVLGALPYRK